MNKPKSTLLSKNNGKTLRYSGTSIPHPNFTGGFTLPNTSDVGIAILEEPVTDLGFGALPAIGLADELNTASGVEALLNIVGYSRQEVMPELINERIRYQPTPMLVELDSAASCGWSIRLSPNPGQGGGTGKACSGDSGGPALEAVGSNVVGGVGSFVFNRNCRGIGFIFRVETEHAQVSVNPYMP